MTGQAGQLQRIDAPGGGLDVLDLGVATPFPVSRIYWLRDTPTGGVRGQHAHRTLRQVLVVTSGAVTVTLDDGHRTRVHRLTEDEPALLIDPIQWRELNDLEPGTVIMVLASDSYDPDDYIHDYAEFVRLVRGA